MKKFLIIDDSTFMRMSIKNILTHQGYEVIGEAKNGKIGVEKYKELSPDIVTLDITMPEMGGLDALRKIMEHDADAKVLMVSALGQDRIIQEAIKIGAKGFLTKPFKRELVVSTVSHLCEE